MGDKADQEWVNEHEPTAALGQCEIGGRQVFCVDLPRALCTAMFSKEETPGSQRGKWSNKRRLSQLARNHRHT